MAIYGYVRVSTKEQNLDRQIDAMHEQGITDKFIYADKESGKNFVRPAYKKLLTKVKPGDTIVFHSLDRMGRDYEEMGKQWNYITQVKKAKVKVLDMPLLDTGEGKGDITEKLVADIVFKLLCYLSQKERENTLKRQEEGIKAAKSRGVRFGRPRLEKPEGYEECSRLWQEEVISAREAARRLGCSHTAFLNWMKEEGKKKKAEQEEEKEKDEGKQEE